MRTCFLRSYLGQARYRGVRQMFESYQLNDMAMCEFSLHTIGIILHRARKLDVFATFLGDLIVDGVEVLGLESADLQNIGEICTRFDLDFAYQYAVARKLGLLLVIFDHDFGRIHLR